MSTYEHRISEQLGWTHFQRRARIVSRLMIEQRIYDFGFAQRHRYRTSLDLPLSGEKLDPHEFYLLLSNELLWQVEKEVRDSWADRIGVSLGYLLSAKSRVEVSYIQRLEDFNNALDSTPFFNTHFLFSF